MADCDIIDSLKDFIIDKMLKSGFENQKEALCFLDEDWKMIGDKKAFLIYYKIGNIYWVHYLWSIKPRQMYSVLLEFQKIAHPDRDIILFNSTDFKKMFGSHAKKLYIWTKEL